MATSPLQHIETAGTAVAVAVAGAAAAATRRSRAPGNYFILFYFFAPLTWFLFTIRHAHEVRPATTMNGHVTSSTSKRQQQQPLKTCLRREPPIYI